MWASEHFGVAPDIVALAKGIASGMPLGAMIARSEIMDWEAGSNASTFGGNPVACAAALATIRLIEETLMANARTQGGRLLDGLRKLQKDYECLGDVRGMGLMVGVEIVKDRATKERALQEAHEVADECFRRGLLVLPCGPNSIRFSPPLTLTAAQADTAFSIFAEALKVVEDRQ